MSRFHEMMGLPQPKFVMKSQTTGTLSALNLESTRSPTNGSPGSKSSLSERKCTADKNKKQHEELSAFMQHAAMTNPAKSRMGKSGAGSMLATRGDRRRSSGMSTFSEDELTRLRERMKQKKAQNSGDIQALHSPTTAC